MTPIEPRHAEEAASLRRRLRVAKHSRWHPYALEVVNIAEAAIEALARHEVELLARDEREKAKDAAIAEAVRRCDHGWVKPYIVDPLRPFLPTPQPDPLVELIRHEMMSGDHPVSAWEIQFATKIRSLLEISKKGE